MIHIKVSPSYWGKLERLLLYEFQKIQQTIL